MPTFREKVIKEALLQKQLKLEGKPIPSSDKKYARLSGLVMLIAGSVGFLFVAQVVDDVSLLSVFAILFMIVITIAGILQFLTGMHLLTKR